MLPDIPDFSCCSNRQQTRKHQYMYNSWSRISDHSHSINNYQTMNHQDTELGLEGNLTESLFVATNTPFENEQSTDHPRPSEVSRPSESPMRASQLHDLVKPEFYHQDNWFDEMCEVLFKLKRRNTTVKAEFYYGVIHFISCLYCLAVVPQQLQNASYEGRPTVVSVALCSGVGSILCGLFANLPFVLAPPTVVSIFLSVFLQQMDEGPNEGSLAVILSGIALLFFGWKPLGRLVARLIPISIQVGTVVGIGLLTSLAGSTEINLVEKGSYTILKMGPITAKICIAFAGVIIICVAMSFHWKGSFCIAVVFCSIVWWWYDNSFPDSVADAPDLNFINFRSADEDNTALLTVDLVFLYLLYLNGLMTSLSNLAVLTREDSTIPRGRWIYIICGIFTILAGLSSSAPILVSPESSASIKEGAKTGLSAVVAGILFVITCFFAPVFESVPATGTSPVLIMIGIILIQNVSRIDWKNITHAAPAFIVLFYIPFTYSVIQGVLLGYVVYLCISLCTGELLDNTLDFVTMYFPSYEEPMRNLLASYGVVRPSAGGDEDSSSKMLRESRVTSTSRRTGLSLFDDSKREGESREHIPGADMAMSDGHTTVLHPNDSLSVPNRVASVDFNMDFRKTTTDEQQQHATMM